MSARCGPPTARPAPGNPRHRDPRRAPASIAPASAPASTAAMAQRCRVYPRRCAVALFASRPAGFGVTGRRAAAGYATNVPGPLVPLLPHGSQPSRAGRGCCLVNSGTRQAIPSRFPNSSDVLTGAADRSIGNIRPHLADARALPFAAAAFDAACLVAVLGRAPGRLAALMELRRVLRPGGRLMVGEFADRHHVPLATLMRLANETGLHLRRRTGVPLAYYALLAPCDSARPRLPAGGLGTQLDLSAGP